jgi:hypothetical protein
LWRQPRRSAGMSENLMDSIAPQLAPPVSREPMRTVSEAEAEGGADVMQISPFSVGTWFADDDAE